MNKMFLTFMEFIFVEVISDADSCGLESLPLIKIIDQEPMEVTIQNESGVTTGLNLSIKVQIRRLT